MKDIAVELSRRTTPDVIKEQLRTMATEKSGALKGRAREAAMKRRAVVVQDARQHRGLLSGLGVIGGAMAGRYLVRKSLERAGKYERLPGPGGEYGTFGRYGREGLPPGTFYEPVGGYRGEATGYAGSDVGATYGVEERREEVERGQGIGEKIDSVRSRAGEKFGHAKSGISEKVEHARTGISEKTGDFRTRSTRSMELHPLSFAAAAFGLGMLAAAFIPIGKKENELMGSARDRARRRLAKLGEKFEQRVGGESREERGHGAEFEPGGEIGGFERTEAASTTGEEPPPSLH